jgi:hypothetical protein
MCPSSNALVLFPLSAVPVCARHGCPELCSATTSPSPWRVHSGAPEPYFSRAPALHGLLHPVPQVPLPIPERQTQTPLSSVFFHSGDACSPWTAPSEPSRATTTRQPALHQPREAPRPFHWIPSALHQLPNARRRTPPAAARPRRGQPPPSVPRPNQPPCELPQPLPVLTDPQSLSNSDRSPVADERRPPPPPARRGTTLSGLPQLKLILHQDSSYRQEAPQPPPHRPRPPDRRAHYSPPPPATGLCRAAATSHPRTNSKCLQVRKGSQVPPHSFPLTAGDRQRWITPVKPHAPSLTEAEDPGLEGAKTKGVICKACDS